MRITKHCKPVHLSLQLRVVILTALQGLEAPISNDGKPEGSMASATEEVRTADRDCWCSIHSLTSAETIPRACQQNVCTSRHNIALFVTH